MSKYPLRMVTVCVEYTDLLAVTLPYNRHHFTEVLVVTSIGDRANVAPVAEALECNLYSTDAFYAHGAKFNKWAALEEALTHFGRHGWLCLMDADVLWPSNVELDLEPGRLYGPLRRMLPLTNPPELWNHNTYPDGNPRGIIAHLPFPPERRWWEYPVHRNIGEWAGYSQIFHATDPVLGTPPWHETNWKHAGGADSFFQQKWPLTRRVRPNWEVLHLGEAGQNWMGRVTPFLGGNSPTQAGDRMKEMQMMWAGRRGRQGPDRFGPERLGGG